MNEGPLVRQGVGAFHIQPAGREERPSKLGALNVALRSGSSGPCGAPSVDQPLGLGSGPGQMFRAVVRRRLGDRPCRGGQTRQGRAVPCGRTPPPRPLLAAHTSLAGAARLPLRSFRRVPTPAFTPFRPSLSRCTPTTFRLPMEKKPGGLAHAHTVCLALLKTGASHCEGDVFVYQKPRPWVKAGLYSLKSESRSYFRGPEAPQVTAGDSGRLLPSRRMAVLILGTVFDRLSQLIGQ